jgi:hypothetical protein
MMRLVNMIGMVFPGQKFRYAERSGTTEAIPESAPSCSFCSYTIRRTHRSIVRGNVFQAASLTGRQISVSSPVSLSYLWQPV